MMNYEMFIEVFKSRIGTAMDISMENITFVKEGGELSPEGDRLLIKFAEYDDAWEMCGLHIRELYTEYQNGRSVESIVVSVINEIKNIGNTNVYEEAKEIYNYEKIKDKLFIRLLNANEHAAVLANTIYKTIGDIALVVYMRISDKNNTIISTKILQSITEEWKISPEKVFQEALINTYRMTPPRIYNWMDWILSSSCKGLEYTGENFMSPDINYTINQDMTGNCLSTTQKTNGAVAVFLPGVAERLAELLNGDFYMVFTSIHEVMIHKTSTVNPKDLADILYDTMETDTPMEDRLTYKIYKYEKETGKFSVVE